MESSQSAVADSSSGESSSSALLSFHTVPNMTTCTSANISWVYSGPSTYLALTAVHATVINQTVQVLNDKDNDLPSLFLASIDTSTSFWNWDMVYVLGTYAIQASTPTLYILSNTFVVTEGNIASCALSSSPNVSSGVPDSTITVTQSPSTSFISTPSSKPITGDVTGGVIGGVIGIIVIVTLSLLLFRFRRRSTSQLRAHPFRTTRPSPDPVSAFPPPGIGEHAGISRVAADPPRLRSSLVVPLYNSREERLVYTGSIVGSNPFDDPRMEEAAGNNLSVVNLPRLPPTQPLFRSPSRAPSYTSREEHHTEIANTAESDPLHSPLTLPPSLQYSVLLPHSSSGEQPHTRPTGVAHSHSFNESVMEELAQNGTLVIDTPHPSPVQSLLPPSYISREGSHTRLVSTAESNPFCDPLPVYSAIASHIRGPGAKNP